MWTTRRDTTGAGRATTTGRRAWPDTLCPEASRRAVGLLVWDTGIRNALLNAFSTDALRPDIVTLWESWVIAEVAKHNALLGSPAELFFWRTRAQSEVDLVVKQASGLRAFEIKWSARRVVGRAFRDAYGVEVEPIRPDNPLFAAGLIEAERAALGAD